MHYNAGTAQILFQNGNSGQHLEYMDIKEQIFCDALMGVSPILELFDLLSWADDCKIGVGLVTNPPKNNKDVVLAARGPTGRFQPLVLGADYGPPCNTPPHALNNGFRRCGH